MEMMRGFSKKYGRRSYRLPYRCMQGKSYPAYGSDFSPMVEHRGFLLRGGAFRSIAARFPPRRPPKKAKPLAFS